jgi:hypothetical protein
VTPRGPVSRNVTRAECPFAARSVEFDDQAMAVVKPFAIGLYEPAALFDVVREKRPDRVLAVVVDSLANRAATTAMLAARWSSTACFWNDSSTSSRESKSEPLKSLHRGHSRIRIGGVEQPAQGRNRFADLVVRQPNSRLTQRAPAHAAATRLGRPCLHEPSLRIVERAQRLAPQREAIEGRAGLAGPVCGNVPRLAA